MGIRHAYQSGTANDPTDEISSTRWNEDHAVTDFLWPAITAVPALDQADWNPTGWNGAQPSRAVLIRAEPASVSFIGGLQGGVDGRVAIIKNNTVDGLICLLDNDSASTAANRFALRRDSVWLLPRQFVTLSYAPDELRWEVRSLSFDARQVDYNSYLVLPGTGTAVVSTNLATSNTATLSTTQVTGTPTNDFLANPFTQITNSTAAGSSDVRTSGAVHLTRGATAGRQGFWFNSAFRITAASATGCGFVGVTSATGAQSVVPDTLNHSLLCGILSEGQTTLRVGSRDATAMTQVDLGANFPVPNATAAYEVSLMGVAAQSRVIYAVRRLDSRQVAGGAITANLPGNTTGMMLRANVRVGATASAATLQFNRLFARNLNY